MTDQEFKEYQEKRWEELPIDIKERAKVILSKGLEDHVKREIVLMYNREPLNWISPHHHYWGMSVRNYLRKEGLTDDQVPSGNLDDYYVQCIEYTLGLRSE